MEKSETHAVRDCLHCTHKDFVLLGDDTSSTFPENYICDYRPDWDALTVPVVVKDGKLTKHGFSDGLCEHFTDENWYDHIKISKSREAA